jgi:alkane 1-monooxygenase
VADLSVPPVTAADIPAWRDPKRYLWPMGLLVPMTPFLAFGLARHTGGQGWWWLPIGLIFGFIPIMDLVVGEDIGNPPAALTEALSADRYYRWLTYLYLPLLYGALVLACWQWTGGGLGWAAQLGMLLSVGTVSGIGINAAHELGHKREDVERWLSKIALAPTMYGHFYVEHNRGHHTKVATPPDPASSRLGESFWAFWPRTVAGGLLSAWRLESSRLRLRGRGRWTWRNDLLNAWAMTLALFGALSLAFGPAALAFLLIQAVVGLTVLELVNYLEHYGLSRQRTEAGRYEKVDRRHSWNSDRLTTNVYLYQLQRHSDHHANPLRRYQVLRSFDASPTLPTGYAGMIVLALLPPLWRRVMDHRVLAHYGGDLTLANLHPPARDRLLRRWPPPPATRKTSARTRPHRS